MPDVAPDKLLNPSLPFYKGERCKRVKVVVLGAGGAGVSTFIGRQRIGPSCGNQFELPFDCNEDFEYHSIPLIRDGDPIRAQWETINAAFFNDGPMVLCDRVCQDMIKTCDCCVFIYSCTSKRSFQALNNMWDRFVAPQGEVEISTKSFWVLSNKIDLFAECGEVPQVEAENWSMTRGANFRNVSGRTGEGFDRLGFAIAQAALDMRQASEFSSGVNK